MFTGITCGTCTRALSFATTADGRFEEPARLIHDGLLKSSCNRHGIDPAAVRARDERLAEHNARLAGFQTELDSAQGDVDTLQIAINIHLAKIDLIAENDPKRARRVGGHFARIRILKEEKTTAQRRVEIAKSDLAIFGTFLG